MIPKLRNCQNLRKATGNICDVCGICRGVDKKQISKRQKWTKKPRKYCTKIKPVSKPNMFYFSAIHCPRLRVPNYGRLYPESCHLNAWSPFMKRCAFACSDGFQLQGPQMRTCVTPGVWDGGFQITRCVGKEIFCRHYSTTIIKVHVDTHH